MTRSARHFALFLAVSTSIATAAVTVSPVSAGGDASVSDASAPPIEIDGCWTGTVANDSQGNNSITFTFDQNGKKLRHGSRVAAGSCAGRCGSYVRVGDSVTVFSPIGGAVDPTGFTFDGHFKFLAPVPLSVRAPRIGCRITGQGILQNDGSISGSYSYQGRCAVFGYVGGDFSLTSSCN